MNKVKIGRFIIMRLMVFGNRSYLSFHAKLAKRDQLPVVDDIWRNWKNVSAKLWHLLLRKSAIGVFIYLSNE